MRFGLDAILHPRKKEVQAPPAQHIAFDQHSMIIDGKRTVIRSGAFHYFRLPAPELWKDRLCKIKQAGYNTVDLYFNWGYHSSAPGEYDFSGVRDVDRLLDLCEETGLYVIARPGPYINAEVDGGGHPAWVLADVRANLRSLERGVHTDSPTYLDYVRQWYGQVVPRIVRHPNVILFQIENEYANDDLNPRYMEFLRDLARELGVKAPLIHNDLWKLGCWADLVDIYGVDDYPVSSFKEDWRGKNELLAGLDGLDEVKRQYCTRSPLAIYELQGGWFDPWNGIGYDEIRRRLGRENMDLVTWTALAQGTTIYNHYMFVGGTNWDHVGAPVVHSSYDYGAPVSEWGGTTERYHAARAIAMLVGAFEDVFALSEPCSDVQASDPALLYKARQQGAARIAFLRNLSGETRSTTLRVGDTETGAVSIAPWSMRVALLKAPFVDGRFTASCNVLTALHHGNQHIIVFYGPGKVTWTLPVSLRMLRDDLSSQIESNTIATTYDGQEWKDVVFSSGGHRYRCVFAPNADEVWVSGDYLLLGPSYVGEGRMKGGKVDLPRYEMRMQSAAPQEKQVRIYSTVYMSRPEINDQMIIGSSDSMAGYLRFDLPQPPAVSLPALGPWRVQQAMESGQPQAGSDWRVLAAGQSLEMDKLGISKGFAWYRVAYSGKMAGVGLAIRHNAALYLNGRFVTALDDYHNEAADGEAESETLQLARVQLPATLQSDGDNVMTILVESLGHNKGFLGNERLPRGILAVEAARTLAWSVRAGVAGEGNVPGLTYDDSAWATVADLGRAPADDVLWARMHFALDVPEDAFAPLGLHMDGVADKAHVYLNGVLVARDWSISKQRMFYLPEGILNQHGDNVLALLLWRRGGRPVAGTVELKAYTVEASNHISVL